MPRGYPSCHRIPTFPWDLDALPYVAFPDAHCLPPVPGLYFFRTNNQVLYIGLSSNLHTRVKSHERLELFQPVMVPIEVAWLVCPHATKEMLAELEKQAIVHYQPLFNGIAYYTKRSFMAKAYAEGIAKNLALVHTLTKPRIRPYPLVTETDEYPTQRSRALAPTP